ncbi:MAG: YccF domain-containing protein [Tenuifilaceae bacterium]
MRILGNIIWLLFGGIFIFIEYLISGFLLCITIIGIPFGLQIFKLAFVALWPFGTKIENTPSSNGCLNIFMNILWLLLGGIWIALSHAVIGLLLAITIIGIPFTIQHFKLAGIALSPFGKTIS